MPYQFTLEQRAEITRLFGEGNGTNGNFSEMYAYMSDVLTTPDANGVVPNSDPVDRTINRARNTSKRR